MPGTTEPRCGFNYKWQVDDNFADQMDGNLLLIAFLLRPAVINRTQTTAPSTPTNGDAYIVAASGATGVFAGKEKHFAYYNAAEGGWIFINPKDGQMAVVISEGTWGTQTVFKGGSWSPGVALG